MNLLFGVPPGLLDLPFYDFPGFPLGSWRKGKTVGGLFARERQKGWGKIINSAERADLVQLDPGG